MLLNIPFNLLTLSIRTRLNFKTDDSLMQGVLDLRCLDHNVPVIVQDVFESVLIWDVDELANWDT